MGETVYARQDSPIKNKVTPTWITKQKMDEIDKQEEQKHSIMNQSKDSRFTFGDPINEDDKMGSTALGWTKNKHFQEEKVAPQKTGGFALRPEMIIKDDESAEKEEPTYTIENATSLKEL